jgi:endonuclease-3 related protein
MATLDDKSLRHALLAVNGVGPETADDILLYACDRPVFVIDAYTRRIFSRLGLVTGDETYEQLRQVFEKALARGSRYERVKLFNEYHALIVSHGKDVCRTKPRCDMCCLKSSCPASSD